MKKFFYDENGNRISYNCNQRINRGTGINGRIYRTSDEFIDDDLCIKLLNIGAVIRLEELKVIMGMDLENFYKIYRILYNRWHQPKAYITKYYQPEDIDILTVPTEYTLDSFNILYNQSIKLSQAGIVIDDLHTGNIVFTQNGIIVLDVDNYYFGTIITRQRIVTKNQGAINYLFKSLYIDALERHHYSPDNYDVKQLFPPYQRPETLQKTLKRYKYPIEYFK